MCCLSHHLRKDRTAPWSVHNVTGDGGLAGGSSLRPVKLCRLRPGFSALAIAIAETDEAERKGPHEA